MDRSGSWFSEANREGRLGLKHFLVGVRPEIYDPAAGGYTLRPPMEGVPAFLNSLQLLQAHFSQPSAARPVRFFTVSVGRPGTDESHPPEIG